MLNLGIAWETGAHADREQGSQFPGDGAGFWLGPCCTRWRGGALDTIGDFDSPKTTGLLRRRDVQKSPGQAWLTRVGLTVFDGRAKGGDSTARTASTAQTASKLAVKVSLAFPDSGTYKLN